MAHRGPIQQFTECCLACGQNVWETDSCVGDKPKKRKKKRKTDDWEDCSW